MLGSLLPAGNFLCVNSKLGNFLKASYMTLDVIKLVKIFKS